MRTGLAGLVAVVMLAAGCNGDSGAEPTPSPPVAPSSSLPSPSTSPSPSPPDEPVLPQAAIERSEAGARAFVRFWLATANHAQATGETDALTAIQDRSCDWCAGGVEFVQEVYESGGRLVGGAISVGRLQRRPPVLNADFGFFGRVTYDEQVTYWGDGRVDRSGGGRSDFYVYPRWASNSWKIRWVRTPS